MDAPPGLLPTHGAAPGDLAAGAAHLDVTRHVETVVSGVTHFGGVLRLDLVLESTLDQPWRPDLECAIVDIRCASGRVAALNADNGGSGRSPDDPALFGFSRGFGARGPVQRGEPIAGRTLRFMAPGYERFRLRLVARTPRSRALTMTPLEACRCAACAGLEATRLELEVRPLGLRVTARRVAATV